MTNLQCLSCDTPLVWQTSVPFIECSSCSAKINIKQGVPSFINSNRVVENFSFEWTLHRDTQIDTHQRHDSEQYFFKKTGFSATDLQDKQILDVGVGTGRYADIASRYGGHVTGIDLSDSVYSAQKNIGDRPAVSILQADIFNLPFKKESFDIIYSIGVLHHTPDCRAAFEALIPLLRPGGTIAIWVYNAHVWQPGSMKETSNKIWRYLAQFLPPRLLYSLLKLEIPYYYLRKIPGFEKILKLLLPGMLYYAIPPTNNKRRLSEHLLDQFDWLSPKYQSKHTYPEVFEWFETAGLHNIRIFPQPISISGQKPIS